MARCALLVGLVACLVAGPARAETIRVEKGGSDAPNCGRSPNPPCLHIAAALGLTPGAQDGDVISIGPGDFVEDPISTNKNLRFIGAGAGTLDTFDPAIHTRLRPGSDALEALKLAGNGGAVERMRIEAFDGSGLTNRALRIDPPADLTPKTFVVNDVTAATPGSDQTGVVVSSSGSGSTRAEVLISRSRISSADTDSDSTGMVIVGQGPAFGVTLSDSFVTSVFGAIEVRGTPLTVRRSTIEAGEVGIDAQSDLTIERSRILATWAGIRLRDDQSVLVRSSLVVAESAANVPGRIEAPIALENSLGTIDLMTIGSTLIGRGQVDGGLVVNTAAGALAIVELRGTAVESAGTELRTLGGGTESVTASHSAFGDASGNVPVPGSGTNVAGAALLGADFKPLGGSPLINRGDPALFAAGELDLAGVPRGPQPEIGAFEYVPPPAPPGPGTNVAPVLSSVSLLRRVFAPTTRGGVISQRRKRTVKRGTRFRFTLSEAAIVSVAVERKLPGRRVRARGRTRCVPPKPSNRKRPRCARYRRAGELSTRGVAGRNTLAFSGRFRGKALRPGSYRARMVAKDAGGLRSRQIVLSFRVVPG